ERGHTDRVNAVAFSPDGRLLASAGNDLAIRIWDVAARTLAGPPSIQHEGWINSLAFSSDGLLLASGSQDGTARIDYVKSLLDAPDSGKSTECYRSFRSERVYEGMDITGVTGLAEGQVRSLRALGAITRDPFSKPLDLSGEW